MKNYTLPANNTVRRFRYYQKLTAIRKNPKMQFGLEVDKCAGTNKLLKSENK